MKVARFDSGLKFGDKNLRWGSPSYLLEPGDPGYVADPNSASFPKPTKRPRKYMASNPTPNPYDELVASGEDLCDGLQQHETAVGVKQNTLAATRADLDAFIAAHDASKAAEGAQPAAYTALRVADSNGKGFIAAAIKVLSLSLGNDWSDEWLATGLPDNTVGVPRTQDKRFTALSGFKAYFTANPGKENAPLNVTAAAALARHTAVSDARKGVNNALKDTKAAFIVSDAMETAFRDRYRGALDELDQLLDAEDPRWYDFGLNRPADPATPGAPLNVVASALGGGRVLVQIDGAKRANSFNFYRQIAGTDAKPVKVTNSAGTQHTIEALPVGATVAITVSGVNDAGEGQASEPVNVAVT